MVECDPQPGGAVFVSASKAIGAFQLSMGVSDEELVPPPRYTPPPPLAKLPVGIIGAGAAGLYTAMILDSLDIKYEILEASGRHGGRLYTHNFSKLPGPYQYFVSSSTCHEPTYQKSFAGCWSHALSRYRSHETHLPPDSQQTYRGHNVQSQNLPSLQRYSHDEGRVSRV